MGWAVFSLAIVALALVVTFVGLYVAELKKRHKAVSEAVELLVGLQGARTAVKALKASEGRLEAQMGVLRKHLEEAEDALATVDTAAGLRDRIDKLLSGSLPEDDQGAGEGGGAVSSTPTSDPADGQE